VILWSSIEVLIAHICFSLPTFRVLFRRKRVEAGSVVERNIESRSTVRTVERDWFDNFSSNPNSPLTGVRVGEVVFPGQVYGYARVGDDGAIVADAGGGMQGGRKGNWTLVPTRYESDDETERALALVRDRDSEDSASDMGRVDNGRDGRTVHHTA
jgi:hypothetical protein